MQEQDEEMEDGGCVVKRLIIADPKAEMRTWGVK